jgi:hypothetical protein
MTLILFLVHFTLIKPALQSYANDQTACEAYAKYHGDHIYKMVITSDSASLETTDSVISEGRCVNAMHWDWIGKQ